MLPGGHRPGPTFSPGTLTSCVGERKQRITDACSARYLVGDEGEYEYHYYPAMAPAYIGRRANGLWLIRSFGVDRRTPSAVQSYRVQNYQFFGAPVGLFLLLIGIWSRAVGSITDVLQSSCWQRRGGLGELCPGGFLPYHDSVMPFWRRPLSRCWFAACRLATPTDALGEQLPDGAGCPEFHDWTGLISLRAQPFAWQ
jgi:hypothetical protein